jgi:hypothetical protein
MQNKEPLVANTLPTEGATKEQTMKIRTKVKAGQGIVTTSPTH